VFVDTNLKLALAAARLDLWEWDIPSNRVTWSNRLHETLSTPPRSFGGTYEAFLEYVHPEDRPGFVSSLKSTLEDPEEGDHFDLDLRVLRPGGEVRCLHLQSQVFRDQTGKPLRMMGVGMDITERKRAEETLRRLKRRFEEAFQQSPAIMMISTFPEGKILEVNAAFPQNLGYDREEVIGRTEEEIGLWATSEMRAEICCRLGEEGPVHHLPGNLLCKSGALLSVLGSFVRIQMEGQTCLLATMIELEEA
jgi:PAS domain S-box-containing protein